MAHRIPQKFLPELSTQDGSGKAYRMKIKFSNRLSALALLGKACHWYADRQEQTGPDGGPIQKTINVCFVKPSVSPEESYSPLMNGS